mgnify:CR=1 FL=1
MGTSARHCAGGVQSKHILGPRPARLQEQASRIQCPEISLNWCQTTSQCTHLHIDQNNLVKSQQKNFKYAEKNHLFGLSGLNGGLC